MTLGWKKWQSNTKVLQPKPPTLWATPQVSAVSVYAGLGSWRGCFENSVLHLGA